MDWTDAILHTRVNGRVRCELCPHGCAVSPGQLGACKVRRGTTRGMQTATFATSVGHLDAIERKPFYHYRPGSRTVTLAAPGCSLRCDYCVNHRLSQYGRDDEPVWTARPVDPEAAVEHAAGLGAGIALSYSEPSLAIELTLALATAGRRAGVDVVWKSNGFLTAQAVEVAAPALAAVNIDLKSVDDERHRRLTGAPCAPVIDAIRGFRDHGVWVEVSTPLIPGVSADPADLTAIAQTVAAIDPGMPWHLLRFTPAYRRSGDAPTGPDALRSAVAIGRRAGLRHVYVERALGADGRTTYCPACGEPVVERDVWALRRDGLADGRCPRCGHSVEGRW